MSSPSGRASASSSLSLGLACCAMEVESAVRLGLLVAVDESERVLTDASDETGRRTVLLVAGTVTDALAPAVASLAADLPPGTASRVLRGVREHRAARTGTPRP